MPDSWRLWKRQQCLKSYNQASIAWKDVTSAGFEDWRFPFESFVYRQCLIMRNIFPVLLTIWSLYIQLSFHLFCISSLCSYCQSCPKHGFFFNFIFVALSVIVYNVNSLMPIAQEISHRASPAWRCSAWCCVNRNMYQNFVHTDLSATKGAHHSFQSAWVSMNVVLCKTKIAYILPIFF